MSICVISICVMSTCVMSICVMWSCVTSIFVMSICALSSYVMSVCVCVMSICVVSICVMSSCVMSICVISICVMSTCVMSICVMWSCATSIFVMSICAMSSYVMSVCVCVCDVKLCDVNLCDFNLCDVNLCDVNLCDVKLCDVNLCDVNLCDVKLCDVSARVCDVNLCGVNLSDVNLCDVNLCNANLCAQLPQTQFTHSKAPNPHASKTSTQNFRTSYWHSNPKRNLHTARRQTRMPARHPHKIFAPPIGTATPNAIYTQQAAKPACQEDIDAKFSQLLLAQLPRTQFTHSAPPNPHASRISTQNFRSSYWHSYPERNLHTASRQTRMPGRHRRKVFAPPIGTATPNAIYTQQAAKPARQEDINTQKQRQSGGDQTTPKRTSDPLADAPSPTPAAQKQRQSGGDQTTPKRTSDPLQMLQVPRLPRKSSDRAAETKRRQSVHQTPCRCSKPHACHAKVTAEPRRPNDAKAYIRPRADAPSPTPATQKQRQSGGDQTTPKRTSDPLQMLQVPRLPRKSSGRAAETKRRQSVHQTPCRRSKSHACHAKVQRPARRPAHTKAYIRPRADAASPTPATQNSSGQRGGPRTPKRTSDPVQTQQVPRLPRKSPAASAAARAHQSVHQTPCRCSKSHACHAKVQRPARRPAHTKAYIRPRADAASPTPARQKSSGQRGGPRTPKRTSDPVQTQQVPRLPRKSPAASAAARAHQSVHQTPRRCSKSHACHAKVQRPARRPAHTKAYIRPRADAASPTPATQKSSGQRGGPRTPKRTSDPVQTQQVPRLPRKSPTASAAARAHQSVHQTPRRCSKPHACHAKVQRPARRPAHTKAYIRPCADAASPTPATQSPAASAAARAHQSVHQIPCRCSKSHACHAKAAAERRRPNDAKAYIRPPADAPSPTPATQISSGRAAETKRRQSVHQTPCRCSKSHACHAKAAAEPSCVMSTCVMSSCVTSSCVMSSCVTSICVMSICEMSICVMSICVTSSVKLCDVKLCDVKLCDVKLCDVKQCDVKLCDVKLCDVKLCDVNLRDVKLCDVKLCDVKLCDVKLCDVNLCDMCYSVVCVCVLYCVLMCVCVCVVLRQTEEDAEEGGGGGGGERCQPKNKNPTRQCGEQNLYSQQATKAWKFAIESIPPGFCSKRRQPSKKKHKQQHQLPQPKPAGSLKQNLPPLSPNPYTHLGCNFFYHHHPHRAAKNTLPLASAGRPALVTHIVFLWE